MLESKLCKQPDGSEKYIEGYFLTMDQLEKLVKDFRIYSSDEFFGDDRSAIEYWIKLNIDKKSE